MGSVPVLPQSKDMHIGVRLIGGSKLPIGVNVCLNGCLSVCVCLFVCLLCDTLTTCPGWTPASRPMSAGIGSGLLRPSQDKRYRQLIDGWVDVGSVLSHLKVLTTTVQISELLPLLGLVFLGSPSTTAIFVICNIFRITKCYSYCYVLGQKWESQIPSSNT